MEKIRLTLCFGYFSSKSLSSSYRYKYFEACYSIVGEGFQIPSARFSEDGVFAKVWTPKEKQKAVQVTLSS